MFRCIRKLWCFQLISFIVYRNIQLFKNVCNHVLRYALVYTFRSIAKIKCIFHATSCILFYLNRICLEENNNNFARILLMHVCIFIQASIIIFYHVYVLAHYYTMFELCRELQLSLSVIVIYIYIYIYTKELFWFQAILLGKVTVNMSGNTNKSPQKLHLNVLHLSLIHI